MIFVLFLCLLLLSVASSSEDIIYYDIEVKSSSFQQGDPISFQLPPNHRVKQGIVTRAKNINGGGFAVSGELNNSDGTFRLIVLNGTYYANLDIPEERSYFELRYQEDEMKYRMSRLPYEYFEAIEAREQQQDAPEGTEY